ncbi:hypothetical protein TOPH_04646 [Tolypocladium ophioglossoides CBS 100239]|uniref:Endo-beta-1,2-glucanase SGL domain-containing protein n=1 Tax=Tolypocladium ophioglossoides (strain CBS 100239) TaxID=1163406 RepID=A0A0L0N994_TOLOC|nr:hypothetical protein TOPH_04646 [Tolypocladium ophioglossoides CBS 100239]
MMLLLEGLLAVSGLTVAAALPPASHGQRDAQPPCRFASQWTQQKLLGDPRGFEQDLLFWEGRFHQNDVAYNAANGMSYDGTQLNWTTGERTAKHPFSAASKEALQIMLYARAIAGSPEAARFLTPDKPCEAPGFAVSILEKKLQTYLRFNATYPGFGGFLPWMTTSGNDVEPTWDWVNRVPALDNGELLWAVYACIQALQQTGKPSFVKLAKGWQQWFDYTKTTAVPVFYAGSGRVCAVTTIKDQALPVTSAGQGYQCEGTNYLDDPYEGELFTHFVNLFSNLSKNDKDELWEVKRKKLVSVEYNMGGVGPITVEQGEQPSLALANGTDLVQGIGSRATSRGKSWRCRTTTWISSALAATPVKNQLTASRRLHNNAERARTCNSVVTKVPGLFASVNNSTDPKTDTIIGYISPAGIPSIASQKEQYHDVVTPYGAWPTIMFDKAVGLAWWRNMVIAKKMQNPYGSTESTRVDGELVSALVTWDSKITTVVALLGGVGDLVRDKLKTDGKYSEFISVTEREYSRVFKDLKGEHVELCLPQEVVPDAGLDDFTLCRG